MITKETMQQIIEEENYRQEVRKSLEVPSSPKQRSRVMEFLNSTFFLALLSSLLVPAIIWYYQSSSQKLKEKEVLERKISNVRAEIKNRIDVIMRIDTAWISGYDYAGIINAIKGVIDSTHGFSLYEEYAKRNIFSLITDYEYDLKLEYKKGNDSIILRLPAISKALHKTHEYLLASVPMNYTEKDWEDVDAKEARRNPSNIDEFWPNSDLSIQFITEVIPQLKKFQ
jgi:hypothetical protein